MNSTEEFKSLDLQAVRKDLCALVIDRRHGGRPTKGTTVRFLIRMTWRSAGACRVTDGRGGAGADTIASGLEGAWTSNPV